MCKLCTCEHYLKHLVVRKVWTVISHIHIIELMQGFNMFGQKHLCFLFVGNFKDKGAQSAVQLT